jgi:hypothetical protein
MAAETYIYANYVVPDEVRSLSHARSQVRCYQTDSTDVVGVCHHSGVFLSSAAEAKPAFYQDHSLEFASLLPRAEVRGAHSEAYKHYLPFSPLKVLIAPGITALVIGLIGVLAFLSSIAGSSVLPRVIRSFELLSNSEALRLVSPLVTSFWSRNILAVVLIAVGLCLSIIGFDKQRLFRFASMQQSAALGYIPLLGESYRVSIIENFNIDMRLSPNGDGYIQSAGGDGRVSFQIYLAGEEIKKARESYRKKGEKYDFEAIDNFRLGWIAVQSSPYVKEDLGGRALCLEASLEDQEEAIWHEAISHEYHILPEAIITSVNVSNDDTDVPEEINRMPLWVRPVLDDLSGGHSLRLEFDVYDKSDYLRSWRYTGLDPEKLSNTFLQALSRSTLRYLSLKVEPNAFPELVYPIAESRGRISANRDEVQWRDRSIAHLLGADTYSEDYPLRVTFAAPLTELQAPIVVSFELLIKAAISGVSVDPDHFWLPSGHKSPVRVPIVSPTTCLRGTLTVEPGLFTFQREETSLKVISRRSGVPITSQVITRLVQTLEKDHQVYVKSVVKSAPAIEAQGEQAYQKRSWNIFGLFYTNDKQPIDVYVLLLSRTPLTVSDQIATITSTWGNITCRALQMSKGMGIREEITAKAISLKDSITEVIQPETIATRHLEPVTRILAQDLT